MTVTAAGLSVGSLALIVWTIVAYFRTIPDGKVPRAVGGLVIKAVGTLALAGAAGWLMRGDGASAVGAVIVAVPAVFAALLALTLLFFISQRKTPVGNLQVSVGDRLLAFAAMTAEGTAFHTDQLAGKRTLLKFFRGGW